MKLFYGHLKIAFFGKKNISIPHINKKPGENFFPPDLNLYGKH